MKLTPLDPPRRYTVGRTVPVTISDCARIALEPDEQVTFTTSAGAEYDVARKAWGFYATPSLNARLPRFGLRPVLVKNLERRYFVLLVERGQEEAFEAYVRAEQLAVLGWMDDAATMAAVEGALA
jgi:hypothetical protein